MSLHIEVSQCSLELLWIQIKLNGHSLFVGGVYLPPNLSSNTDTLDSFFNTITLIQSRMKDRDLFVLCGDFNQPGLSWSQNEDYFAPLAVNPASSYFIDGLAEFNLRQLSGVVNIFRRQLDLVFVNELVTYSCSPVSCSIDPIVKLDHYHPPLEFVVNVPLPHNGNNVRDNKSELNFRKMNLEKFREIITNSDWNFLEIRTDSPSTVDVAVEQFSNIVKAALPLCCPRSKPSSRLPWYDATLRSLKADRTRALKKLGSTPSEYNRRVFKYAASAFRIYNRASYRLYLGRLQCMLYRNPKLFWSYAKKRRNPSSLPTSMSLGSVTTDNAADTCSLFAEHFANGLSRPESQPLTESEGILPGLNSVAWAEGIVNVNTVSEALKKLKPSFSPGPDGIPASVLKKSPFLFVPLLVKLFNLSLSSSSFPLLWKRAWLVPIHKKGNPSVISNYRGISIQCAITKVFEHIIHTYVFKLTSSTIIPQQHGFFPNRSTTTNLMSFTSFVSSQLESVKQVDTIYTDFKSAFDRIPHSLLLNKISQLDVNNLFVSWLRSFLCDRSYSVKFNDMFSTPFSCSAGVPQGSVLSPLLFIIFINDVRTTLPPECFLCYADDLKIFLPVSSPSDCISLQNILDRFSSWCSSNSLTLCPDKCNVISFSRSQSPITYSYVLNSVQVNRVCVVKDLGVLLDRGLTFSHHIDSVVNQARKTLGLLKKIACDFSDPMCLKTLFCSLVRSILEYCSVVWSPTARTHVERIERVQRSFTRFAICKILGRLSSPIPPYEDRCRQLGLELLENRRSHAQSSFIAALLLGNIDSPSLLSSIPFYAPNRVLRNRPPLVIPSRRTAVGRNDPLLRAIRRFNCVYSMFDFNLPLSSFRSRIRTLHNPVLP